jgi:hypothetical protein
MRSHPDLIGRARTVTLESMRICARSAALIERCLAAMAVAAAAHQKASAVRTESLRVKERSMPQRMVRGWVDSVRPLPLTPAMLRELADEFRVLASRADTEDSSAAFHDLAFRYTALAAGYDTEQTRSRRVH